MKYAVLFELTVTHGFYQDGRCGDLAIVPSGETTRLLRNHRCTVSTLPSGLRVLMALDSQTGLPLLPIAPDTVLRFHLELQNPDFNLFTDLSALTAQAVPVFTSAGQQGRLLLADRRPGAEALPRGAFAAVELRLGDAGPGAAVPEGPSTPVFTLAFAPKKARWAYYCITDRSGAELEIRDGAPAGLPLLFGAEGRTRLDEHSDPADPIGTQCLQRFPGQRCTRMLSDDVVPCSEQPRKYLELRQGTERLLAQLPNPPLRNVARLGAREPRQDVLFQILDCRTRPLL